VTLMAQVFFATFFGFLGLLLALPLTVVGQVWLKEVIVKDILDQWHTPQQKQAELVLVSEATLAEASEQTRNISQKSATIEDNQNVD
ncbi:MAG: AI-2E family transporter, partial [Coleofasciculaceae cyanobacterium]